MIIENMKNLLETVYITIENNIYNLVENSHFTTYLFFNLFNFKFIILVITLKCHLQI